MEWFIYSSQDLLSLTGKKHGFRKDVHDSSRRSGYMVNLFKGRLTDDPTLDSAVKLMSRKLDISKNPKTSQSFKKQAIKQIDPDIELYIKKSRQLPASLSVNADPTMLAKS